MEGWFDMHSLESPVTDWSPPLTLLRACFGPPPRVLEQGGRARGGGGDSGDGCFEVSAAGTALLAALCAPGPSAAPVACGCALAVLCSDGTVLLLRARPDLAAASVPLPLLQVVGLR